MIGLKVSPVPLPVPSYRCFMVWDNARHTDAHHLWLRHFIGEVIQRAEQGENAITRLSPADEVVLQSA